MANPFDIRKALDTSVATTGDVLVPEIVSAGIRMYAETRSPLYAMIDKFPFQGLAYGYKAQNSLPVASFGAEMGALPLPNHPTYIERSVPMKSLYIAGELSGQLIDGTQSVLDILKREIANSALGMVRKIEETIVGGDSDTVATEFDGLDKWITTELSADVGDGPQPLGLHLLDELIDLPAGGEPTVLIMSKAMHRKLWSVLQPQVRFVDTRIDIVDGAFRVPAYGELPIIRLFDNNAILADTILAPDMTKVFMPILRDITYEDMAKVSDSVRYFLRMYLTMVVEGAERYHAKLVDVTSTIA